MIKLTGLNKYLKKTERQKAQIKNGAANYVRQTVKSVLRDLVLQTPQWSGETASSWRVDINSVPASFAPSTLAVDDWRELIGIASFKGDRQALKVALEEASPALKAIRYNTNIRIVNTSPMADELATGEQGVDFNLRPGNFIPGDIMAVKTVAMKYKLSSNIVGLDLKRVMNYD